MCHPHHHKVRKQISLLVPFQSIDPIRIRAWNWLREYWHHELPEVEIVIGHDRRSKPVWWRKRPVPFSKAEAVNDAFRRSHGDIIVILDSDTYMDSKVIEHCAKRLRAQRKKGVRSWFVPYRNIARLTQEATEEILESSPCEPLALSDPPPAVDIESNNNGSGWGHYYGALIQIMPREAFITVGGMDPRFRGWGGEDVSFLKALDTLWGKHRLTPNDVLHLWHPIFVSGAWIDPRAKDWTIRMWPGQHKPRLNDWLSSRYNHATFQVTKMRALVNEGHEKNIWGKPKGAK